MSLKIKVAAIASIAALALAGCAQTATPTATAAANSNIKICVYTHSDHGSFWSVFEKGAKDAAQSLGVTLDLQGSNNDAQKQAQTITAGVAAGCNGLATSVPDAGAIKTAVAGYVAKNIPFLTVNSGSDVSQSLGAFTHVGQDEMIAGEQAGLKFNALGVKHVLCPIQEAANSGLQLRCDGLKKTFKGTTTDFNLDGALSDLTKATQTLTAEFQSDSSIDAVFALNADVAAKAVLPAEAAAGVTLKVGTVDMSPEALQAIKDGKIEWAIDQQQYAQGYMSVVLLYLAIVNKNELGGGQPIYTGPGFVTADNVDAVMGLVKAGTR